MNRRIFTAAAVALLLPACADKRDDTIAQFTRDYVAGRISRQRYHDLCHAMSARRTYTTGRSTGSDTGSSSDSTTRDDKKHEGGPPPPPPPGTMPPSGSVPHPGTVPPPLPPPNRRDE